MVNWAIVKELRGEHNDGEANTTMARRACLRVNGITQTRSISRAAIGYKRLQGRDGMAVRTASARVALDEIR